jgi:DNA-binding CsgD family transcriptional regulator
MKPSMPPPTVLDRSILGPMPAVFSDLDELWDCLTKLLETAGEFRSARFAVGLAEANPPARFCWQAPGSAWRGDLVETHLVFRDGAAVDSMLSLLHDGEFAPADLEFVRGLQAVIQGALRLLGDKPRSRSRDAALGRFFRSLPIPVLLLDDDLRLVFASREGYDACALWNLGARVARGVNSREAFQLPDLVGAACRRLGLGRPQRARPGQTGASPAERVVHATNGEMVAQVTRSDAGSGLWARAGFFVTFAIERNLDGAALPDPRLASRHLRLLSRCERRVALLAAEGCDNATIALRLRKSKRTVECQLGSIYQKLGVMNRVQLVRRLV